MIKKISLIITVIGLLILSFFLSFQKSIPITTQQNISDFQDNQRLTFTGLVTEEIPSLKSKTLILDNFLKVYDCPKSNSYLGKNLTVLALLDDFDGKKRLICLKTEFN